MKTHITNVVSFENVWKIVVFLYEKNEFCRETYSCKLLEIIEFFGSSTENDDFGEAGNPLPTPLGILSAHRTLFVLGHATAGAVLET